MDEEWDFSDILDYLDPSVPSKAKQATFDKTLGVNYLQDKRTAAKQVQVNDRLKLKAYKASQKNMNQLMTGGKDMWDFTDILDKQDRINRTLQGPYRGPE